VIVSGRASLAAPREELWAVLSDPGRLAQTLPHVSNVSIEDEHRFSAVAHPVTALGETRVAMEFEIAEQRHGEYVRIVGTGSSGENLLAVEIALELSSDGDGGTTASWRADLALRGVLSSLLQRTAGELLREQVASVLAAGVALSEGDRGG
jgi:carbon monoxide dehydrogenase subunit G